MSVALGSTDLIVRSTNGSVVAFVEIKNRQSLTAELASRYRRNLLAHGLTEASRYLVLMSQDRGYIWRPTFSDSPDLRPDVQFDVTPIIDRYLPHETRNGRLTEGGLTIIAAQWFSDLASGRYRPSDAPERSLVGSGLLEAMRDAQVAIGDEP
jgi:hypothetical protein